MHLILINKNVVTCTLKLLISIYIGSELKFCSFCRKLRDIVSLMSVLRGVRSVVCVVAWSRALRGFELPYYYIY